MLNWWLRWLLALLMKSSVKCSDPSLHALTQVAIFWHINYSIFRCSVFTVHFWGAVQRRGQVVVWDAKGHHSCECACVVLRRKIALVSLCHLSLFLCRCVICAFSRVSFVMCIDWAFEILEVLINCSFAFDWTFEFLDSFNQPDGQPSQPVSQSSPGSTN